MPAATLAPPAGWVADVPAGRDLRRDLRPRLSAAVLIGALTFNAGLCLVNTVAFPVGDTLVMGCEMVLVATALGMAAGRGAGLYVLIGLFLAYMALVMAMRPMLDLKAVRDFLIPIAFYALGRRVADPRLVDRVALIAGAIVLAFGLFEYFALDVYTHVFDILKYYVARGTVAASDAAAQAKGDGSTLFASGMRPDARNILPFLGPHRVSSVFLEPVSTGNFGAILVMWALVRPGLRWRAALFALGAAAVVMSDARFGLYTCLAVAAVAGAKAALPGLDAPRWTVFLAPFAILTALAIYGMASAQVDWTNDLSGRLLWTARLITSLDAAGVFGLISEKVFLDDSGYAYSLAEIGLVGLVAFWALFVFVRETNPDAWRFKLLVAIYLILLLLISSSPYSIKTGALLWFMLGTSDAVPGVGRRLPSVGPVSRP